MNMKDRPTEKKGSKVQKNKNGLSDNSRRMPVAKTHKLYIGGQFPRTESGRYIPITLKDGMVINTCRASVKDFRNSVVAARSACKSWVGRSAFNRAQILYRIAEVMEGRKVQFIEDLLQQGTEEPVAIRQVEKAIDCAVYYAGWCDKYSQIFSTVNPVATSHFNFSIPEPVGVTGILCPETGDLYTIVSLLMPVIAGANVAVLLVPSRLTTSAINFAEVLQTSDLPAGVVNILTGLRDELLFHFGSHRDVDAVVIGGGSQQEITKIQEFAAAHVLRIIVRKEEELEAQGPYNILDTQEIKTTWHPIGK